MAVLLRRGFDNLSMGSSFNALSLFSTFVQPLGKRSAQIHVNCNHAFRCPLRLQIGGFSSDDAEIEVRKIVSNKNSHISSSNSCRFHVLAKGRGSSAHPHIPLLGAKGRNTGGELLPKRLLSVIIPEGGPQASLGQVSGDLEQEGSEGVSGQSSHSSNSAACGTAQQISATINEVEKIGVIAQLEAALGSPLSQSPQRPPPKPLVIVISGPSGVGKDAVIRKLQLANSDIHVVVTATTRPMRPGEVEGVDYHFVTEREFQDMIQKQELLEHAIVYGDYKGIPKQQVREFMSQGMDVVLRVDVQGAATVKSILGSEAIFIFIVAESEKALVKRLVERKTETMDKMLLRVATAREELKRMGEFDYVVVNKQGCLDRTVESICHMIEAEKARVRPKSAIF